MKGRDPQGKFTQGNSGGPGRPRRALERDYLRALSDACPLEAWQEIVSTAVKAAKGGDAQARAWLGRYLMGAGTLGDSLTGAEQMARMLEEVP